MASLQAVQGITELARSQVGELFALVDDALPRERLTSDELLAGCFDDPGAVLAFSDGSGAVSAVTRSFGELTIGWVRLIAVPSEARRHGRGRALLAAAEDWAYAQGATEMHLGESAPFYFWPGVPGDALEMLCLAEAARYDSVGGELNMSIPTTFRAPAPENVTVRRVVDDAEAEAVGTFIDEHWPWWLAEARRGIEQGGCHAAFDDRDRAVLGFACHSVNRAGWIGPMGTDAVRRGRGVGHALLGALCIDLMTANFRDAEIAWVGPVRFYAKAGARVSRMFRLYRKNKP
jgi:GNAT superfamily N-acetyltransferase